MNEDLAYLPAVEALSAFEKHRLSPVELVAAVLDQADRVETTVNALAHRFPEHALEQARLAERRYMGKGEAPRVLEGLPVAIKEETPVAGRPWTQGSLVYKDAIADLTAPVPERVMAAGGIVHALTTAPEFSCAAWTNSRLHGVTRNPWNPDFSPGGSSGGSAASLASGTSTLATGSDIGGSNRIPAGFCGVVGYKPPYGRVPSYPPFNLDYYNHEGPQGRSVMDCLLLEGVIAGPHPLDVATVPLEAGRLPLSGASAPEYLAECRRLANIAGWRVAVAPSLGGFLVDDEAVANTLAVAHALREAGAIVEEVELRWSRADVAMAASEHFKSLFVPFIAAASREHGELMCEYSLDWLTVCDGPLDLLAGMEMEGRLYAELARIFATHRVLLCSTNGPAGYPADQASLLDLPEVNGFKPQSLFDITPTVVFNMFSRCPVMSVPSGSASNRLPTGVQIAAAPFDESAVFATALAIEALRPWAVGAIRG